MTRRTKLVLLTCFLSCLFVLPMINERIQPLQAPMPPSYLTSDLAKQRPLILCHRGSRYMGPENTIHMHSWALKYGCDVLETDVRLTKDNQLVIFHDDYVDRICNGHGPVRNFTLAELLALDCAYHYSPERVEYQHGHGNTYYDEAAEAKLSHPFRGTGLGKIPLFSEFLDAFPEAFKNIEIKENENLVGDMVLAELKRKQIKPETFVISSRWCEVLEHVRRASNFGVGTGACEREGLIFFLTAKLRLSNLYFYFIRPENSVYQMPTVSSGVPVLASEIVNAAHKLGQKAQYWVVNPADEVSKVLASGADGLVSDRCDVAHQTLYADGFTAQDVTKSMDKSLINTTKAFFIPVAAASEVHTCVSLGCRILPIFFNNGQVVMSAFVSLLVVMVFLMSTPAPAASAPAAGAGAGDSKKKDAKKAKKDQ